MKIPAPASGRQRGMALLEGMIAILIFSLGIIAIVGLQTMAVKQTTDAKYRSEASVLTNQLLGQMWVTDRQGSTLQTQFATGGTGYNAWLDNVRAALPGVADHPPTVAVSPEGEVTIAVYWTAPNDPPTAPPHRYVAVALVK